MNHKNVFCFLITVLLILADQIMKWYYTFHNFFISSIKISLVKNYSLPFNLNLGTFNNNLIISLGLLALIFYVYKYGYKKIKLGLVLIFAGAISNFADRLLFGYVRDIIDIGLGFTFNLADLFIVIGVLILIFKHIETATLGKTTNQMS